MMDKLIKAFYILMIALVVFLGGLLISSGLSSSGAVGDSAAAHAIADDQGGWTL